MTADWCALPRSRERSSMSEQGTPKQDKAAKKGGGEDAAKAEGGKKVAAAAEGGKKGGAPAEGGKKAAAPAEGGKKGEKGAKQPAGPKAGKEARDPNYVPRF